MNTMPSIFSCICSGIKKEGLSDLNAEEITLGLYKVRK